MILGQTTRFEIQLELPTLLVLDYCIVEGPLPAAVQLRY